MRKTPYIKALVLTATLAGSANFLPCAPADAAGFINLDFENVSTLVGIDYFFW